MIDKGIGVIIAIIGLASLAVVVSKKADTSKVLDSLLGGLGKLIRSATSPVTGQ